ncbi:MAG: ATP-binding protein [Candidatus Hadarchaeales archaeon]
MPEMVDIVRLNPWWEGKEKIAEDEKVREALSKEKKLIFPFKEENTLIVGPRQVGKTTFLKLSIWQLLQAGVDPKNLLFFSCDLFKNHKEVVDLVSDFERMREGKRYILLDEISFVDDWERAVKFLLDNFAKDNVFYFSGSSSIELKKERFPGRPIKIKEFMPLDFKDFCRLFGSDELKKTIGEETTPGLEGLHQKSMQLIFRFNEISDLFYRYLKSGGFPRAFYEVLELGDVKKETFEVYWNWLIRDVTKVDRSERIASSVLAALVRRYTTSFSLTAIAKETEIGSHVTVRDYLEILEGLFAVRSYFNYSLSKQIPVFRKNRKVYFTDGFIYRCCKNMLFGEDLREDELPQVVEGIVAEHLWKRWGKVFYLKNRKELDFITGEFGIEVKWQKHVDERDFPRVDVKNKILLSKDKLEFHRGKGLLILPLPIFLLL